MINPFLERVRQQLLGDAQIRRSWGEIGDTIREDYEDLSARLSALDGYARWMLDDYNVIGRPTVPDYGTQPDDVLAAYKRSITPPHCCGGGLNGGDGIPRIHEWNCKVLRQPYRGPDGPFTVVGVKMPDGQVFVERAKPNTVDGTGSPIIEAGMDARARWCKFRDTVNAFMVELTGSELFGADS